MKEIISLLPYYLIALYSAIFYNLCYMKINNYQIKINVKNSLVIIITSIVVLINNSYNNLWIKFILTSIIFLINFKILYKDEIKKIIINYVIIYILIILLEIIVTNLLLKIGIINNNNGVVLYTLSKFILSAIIPLLEYLMFSVKCINKAIKKLVKIFIDSINTSNIAYLLFITFYIIGVLNFENFANKGSLKLIIILCLIFLMLFVMIIKAKTKEEFLKKSNKRLVDFNEKYGQFLDEYKIYKHNIKNKLIGMKAYGNKKINGLIDDLLEEETTFSVKTNNLYNIPDGIKGIVAEKLYSPNINVITNNKIKGDPFIKLNPKEFNTISEVIGICIDNAIEASMETKNPIITLDLYEDENNIYIKTGNNFQNKIDIEKLGDKYYSTKNRGSGLGLFSIMRNKWIKEKISIINDFYYIELTIKKAR